MEERRDRDRVHIGKLVFARNKDQSFGGTIVDISASGLAMKYGAALDPEEKHFERGDPVDLIFDEMMTLSGFVVRADEYGLAITFAHDETSEKHLIAEIMDAM